MRRASMGAAGAAILSTAILVPAAFAQSPSAVPAPASPAASLGSEPVASPAAAGGAVHPAHIHTGTCAELGGVVAPLRDLAPIEPGAAGGTTVTLGGAVEVSVTRVEVPIPQMLRDPHAMYTSI